MFNLMRHYAITSLAGILVAALLLTAFYRHVEIHETTEFARKTNIALTEAVLDSVRQDLGEYLESVADLGPREDWKAPFPQRLVPAIAESMRKASITKVRIYNNRGMVVYSTDRHELGGIDADNPGFASARKGQPASDLTYRDVFSAFAKHTDEDNLVRTFVPVRLSAAEPVAGALATYVDLSPAVAQTEQEVYTVIGGIVLILMLLYSSQLLVVMRAQKVIKAQQDTIRERTATLETLSLQRLAGEEAEKLNLAHNLHEGLAQTLSAIKIGIENSLERIPAGLARDESLKTALSSLQGAIDEVQEMAADLRPSSLDELGLLPTIRWYCREFENLHPDVRIEQQISVQEQDIPEPLKIVIYRIIEAVLKDIGRNSHQDRIRLRLVPNAQAILLAIDDIPQESASIGTAPDGNPRLRFAAAQERATLSGGAFSAAFTSEGGVTLNASWAI
jgi:signal transduction histidine kinase